MKSIYFFTGVITIRYLYVNKKTIIDKIINLFGFKTIKNEEKTPLEKYYDNKKEYLLKTYNNNNEYYNSNIDEVFYNKDTLKNVLEKENNELEKYWKRNIMYESTPRGNIVMYYNPFKLGFVYYSDTSSIPYSLLNAVAMKYSVMFRCRNLFIDNEITPENKESSLIEIHYKETKKKVEEKNNKAKLNADVFVKLKNYSKPSTKKDEEKKKDEDKEIKKEIYKNKFINMGKICNFSFVQKQEINKNKLNGFSSQYIDDLNQETDLQKNVLSFKDFKNRNRNII
jgi:hypothetical protein